MSLLANLIGVANSLTQSFGLQCDVIYYRFSHADGAGRRFYETGVPRTAIYTQKMKQVRTFSGELAVSNAQIAFLDPTPIGEFDKIVTPVNGTLDSSAEAMETAQPIIGIDAFIDSSNNGTLTEIYLG